MDLSKLSDEELDVLAEKARQALEAQEAVDAEEVTWTPIGGGDDVTYESVSIYYPDVEKAEAVEATQWADPNSIKSMLVDFVLTYYVTVNAMGGEQEVININTTDGVLIGVIDDPDTVAVLAALYFDGTE